MSGKVREELGSEAAPQTPAKALRGTSACAAQQRIVVIGAGHGGGNVVGFLRQAGHAGELTLLGDEPVAPYHRPPLSKAFLKGEVDADGLLLRADAFYEKQGITLRLGARAVSIDAGERMVHCDDGATLAYDQLILATGSRARRLAIPGNDLAGILHLRDIADAAAIRAALGPGRRLVVIGGGYVGLEAAASARALGAEATIIEREPRVLARVACAPLAEFFQDYHRGQGVEIRLGASTEAFEGMHGHVTAVRLADGTRIPCDAVLVGVGGVACTELAASAGLACEDGVIVDADGRTSDPAIHAIGDMTRRPMPSYGNRMFRLESVPNAVEQARRVAQDILGLPQPAHEVPWFWSDQYDLKLQIAGVPFDSRHLVLRGSVDAGQFSLLHLDGEGRLLALEAVNMGRDFIAARRMIGARLNPSHAALADPANAIKDLAA